jgi:hypothetical protein
MALSRSSLLFASPPSFEEDEGAEAHAQQLREMM